jgi:hypothetical protein
MIRRWVENGRLRAMQKSRELESLRRMNAHMWISPTEVESFRELYMK